jgi:hypothetical protein
MSISVKLNKNGIKKLQKELEQEMKKRTIVREGVGLRKDSEKFLKIVLEKREENGSDIVTCTLDMFSEIPNIEFNVGNIMDDLKLHNCISSNSTVFISGEVQVILTIDGIEYLAFVQFYKFTYLHIKLIFYFLRRTHTTNNPLI